MVVVHRNAWHVTLRPEIFENLSPSSITFEILQNLFMVPATITVAGCDGWEGERGCTNADRPSDAESLCLHEREVRCAVHHKVREPLRHHLGLVV